MTDKGKASFPKSTELLQAVIDSISDSIALLDGNGTIRMVNEAWQLFAEENQLLCPHYCVNSNYIETCSAPNGLFADDAHVVADMLRDVAAGRRQEIEFEYTCLNPSRKQRFRMRSIQVCQSPRILIVIHRRITEATSQKSAIAERFDDLSPRELEVLKLLAQGQSTKQVAAELHIGVRTAEKHRQMIMRKTRAANIAELVLLVTVGDVVPLELPRSDNEQML